MIKAKVDLLYRSKTSTKYHPEKVFEMNRLREITLAFILQDCLAVKP